MHIVIIVRRGREKLPESHSDGLDNRVWELQILERNQTERSKFVLKLTTFPIENTEQLARARTRAQSRDTTQEHIP